MATFVLVVLLALSSRASAQSNPLSVTLSGSSVLPMREYATRELGDAWDMAERTDIGWFTWGVDEPPSGLAARRVTVDARGNTVFRATANGQAPSLFALDTRVPGAAMIGKIGSNHPIDTTIYRTLYVKLKVARAVLDHAPLAQVFWSQDSIYHDPVARPAGGSIAAFDDNGSSQAGLYLTPAAAPTRGRLEGGNWTIVRIPLTLAAMQAVNPVIDRWRNMGSGATVTWGAPGVIADSLRFSPYHLDGAAIGEFDIDWIRLVDDRTPQSVTVGWTSGTYDVVVSTQSDCSDFAVVGYSRSPGFVFAPGILPAGTYRVGLRKPFTSTGHTAPTPATLESCSTATVTVRALPALTFTAPHPEGSPDDFATNVLGNAWDFDAATDVDYTRNITSASIAAVPATDAAGHDLGSVRVFRTVSALASIIGDPHLYLLWPIATQQGARARGAHARIDAARYRILTAELGTDHQRDLVRGSVGRVVWHVDGDVRPDGRLTEIESEDILLHHVPATENGGRLLLETLQIDMADRASLPVETATPQSNSGWSNVCVPSPGYASCNTSGAGYRPGVDLLRLDVHEFPDALTSAVRRVKLAALERTGPAFDIAWTPSNPSGMTATVTLKAVPVANPALHDYRPRDATCTSQTAVTIASGVSLAAGRHTWQPGSGLADGGEYFVCAQIVVAGVGVVDETLSRWPVIVSRAADRLFTAQPGVLRYAVTVGPSGVVAVTPPQAITVSGPALGWRAATTANWLRIERGAGTGAGLFTVAVVDPGDRFGGASTLTGVVTLTPDAPGIPATHLPVVLTIDRSGGSTTTPPFGVIDTPAPAATGVQGAIGITGWALDDVGVAHVRVYRTCLSFEPAANCATVAGQPGMVYIGDATITRGTRPDVEAAYGTHPEAYDAGWGYLLLTNLAPHVPNRQLFGGQGRIDLWVLATDVEGKQSWLGRTVGTSAAATITMANDSIAKPFGAIDTPRQGEQISGLFPSFGWALTPDTNTVPDAGDVLVPVSGASLQVWVDGAPVGSPEAFSLCRGTTPTPTYCDDDVASIFGHVTPHALYTPRTGNPTRFRNLDAGRGAIGYRFIDTTTLANGLHTIAWSVYDNAGRGEGIGSRYFTVLNTGSRPVDGTLAGAGLSPSDPLNRVPGRSWVPAWAGTGSRPAQAGRHDGVRGRAGFDLEAPLIEVIADDDDIHHVRLADLDRLELVMGPVRAGYLVANGTWRDLPAGSRLEPGTGTFTWMPGPGFFGTYQLAFLRERSRIRIDVTIAPRRPTPAGTDEVRMLLDTPERDGAHDGRLVVRGWALDPQAAMGAGVDAVHVWAVRRDVPGGAPQFLGVAALGEPSPEVARHHGPAFGHAGFRLTAPGLAPGVYDITAYVWASRTARWEDARTVTSSTR